MQWSPSVNAGFSTVAPWLPVDERYKTYNVETEQQDPNSILSYYRQLLSLRHTNKALLDGKYVPLNESDPNVLAYLRSYKDKSVLVLINMSNAPQKVTLDLASKGIQSKSATTLLASFPAPSKMDPSQVPLDPFAAWIAEIDF
jgi:alpha-glucosidase